MLTIDEVKTQIKNKYNFDDTDIEHIVFSFLKFTEMVHNGYIIQSDGTGYFHDGEKETDVSVFSKTVNFYDACKKYPYVCWYNR